MPLDHATTPTPGPGPPVLDSLALDARRAPLLRAEVFEAGPGRLPTATSAAHKLLVPLQDAPLRVSTVRDGVRHELSLGRGDIALTPAGVASAWSWEMPVRVLRLWIDPMTLRDFVSGELRTLVTGTTIAERVTIHDPELSRAARRLGDAARAGEVGSDVLFDARARIFLVTLVRNHALRDAAALDARLDPERYRRLTAFIDDHLEGRIAVGELAAHVGLSETGLARALKAATGATASALILRTRLVRARELMADPARSLTEVAAACGFADQAHLSRSFKARFGVPPRVWRAGLRGAAA